MKTWILPFKFLELVTFIVAFGLIFSEILTSVRLRAATMAEVLPLIKARNASAG